MHDWIADETALARLCASLAPCATIAVDTEFMRVRTYWPELALVQVATPRHLALIDPQAIASLESLRALLVAPGPRKVMHSASEDLVALGRIGARPIANLFDTQVAAAFAGLGPGIGYQRLVHALLGITLEKGETRSDWLRRPLSENQLHYAEQDVLHMPALHDALVAKLEARGMLAWCLEDCDRLARSSDEALPADPHHEFRNAWRWPIERQARLKRLAEWRERTARAIDRPRLWVFDNASAAELVLEPPADADAVRIRLASQRSFPKRAAAELAQLLSQPVLDEELALRPIPEPLRGDDERRADAVRDAIAAKATALDLPPAMLLSRRGIEALVRGHRVVELDGWRGEILADAIAAAPGRSIPRDSEARRG
ncbi:MAG TPA: HRDC domain-containing protein [Candidatus Saccharimonadia bacterium]|nr:HRDC domain-containing protein [Candidatus Saccharimonadia bacterium]